CASRTALACYSPGGVSLTEYPSSAFLRTEDFFFAAFFLAFFFVGFFAVRLPVAFVFAARLRVAGASASAPFPVAAVPAAAVFFFAAFLPRPRRSGAAASSASHSSSVSDFGSRSFGIFAFFAPFVTYGP